MKTADPCASIGGPGCGLKKVLDIIGGKWKILILCLMNEKHKMRYGEIRRSVVGITNTMLAQSLKEMEKDGLVDRHQYNEMPVRVEYSLTPKALSLVPILVELKDWGMKNL
ncbi:winged helix-turn-helix transcriptional regulator [Megasphaera sp. WILCCON 0056]|uniref:winged helix-turn-helix transcriptional regulator n=1 Tax=Megasphaera sp. WILCCON 0056 TaxID=3345340 RepID=UPI003A802138